MEHLYEEGQKAIEKTHVLVMDVVKSYQWEFVEELMTLGVPIPPKIGSSHDKDAVCLDQIKRVLRPHLKEGTSESIFGEVMRAARSDNILMSAMNFIQQQFFIGNESSKEMEKRKTQIESYIGAHFNALKSLVILLIIRCVDSNITKEFESSVVADRKLWPFLDKKIMPLLKSGELTVEINDHQKEYQQLKAQVIVLNTLIVAARKGLDDVVRNTSVKTSF